MWMHPKRPELGFIISRVSSICHRHLIPKSFLPSLSLSVYTGPLTKGQHSRLTAAPSVSVAALISCGLSWLTPCGPSVPPPHVELEEGAHCGLMSPTKPGATRSSCRRPPEHQAPYTPAGIQGNTETPLSFRHFHRHLSAGSCLQPSDYMMTVKVMSSQKTSRLSEAHAMLGAPPAQPDLLEMCSEGLTTPCPVRAQCSASGTRSEQGQGLPWTPQLLRAELSTAHLRGQRGVGQSSHSGGPEHRPC